MLSILVVLSALVGGCATAINSPAQAVQFWSQPPGADVIIDGVIHVKTPGTVRLSRLGPHSAVFQKDGYEPKKVAITRGMSKWVFMDIVCLIFVTKCVSEDIEDGGFYKFDDKINVKLIGLPSDAAPSSR